MKGERMNASELTEEQIDYICRYCIAPVYREAKTYGANAQMEKIEQIFRTVGYWKEESGS
jgi:hypothetical protein